jgi:hypothetical protein
MSNYRDKTHQLKCWVIDLEFEDATITIQEVAPHCNALKIVVDGTISGRDLDRLAKQLLKIHVEYVK